MKRYFLIELIKTITRVVYKFADFLFELAFSQINKSFEQFFPTIFLNKYIIII